jgi:endonuclease YncB( thermonuclease family)
MSELVSRFAWGTLVALALACSLLLGGFTGLSTVRAAPLVSGDARVIDGDTIDVSGTRIRLEGIDAPETAQTCSRNPAGSWPCGREAQKALARMIEGRQVACTAEGYDRYGRMLGVCSVGSEDVNAAMVRNGYAWAFVKYSTRYTSEEAAARDAKAGIWQSESQPAWEFREKRWLVAEDKAPDGCAIKGNVSESGHIYHMPWGPWYGKVRIETAKGERWFCSEEEAVAAGFRPAMQH